MTRTDREAAAVDFFRRAMRRDRALGRPWFGWRERLDALDAEPAGPTPRAGDPSAARVPRWVLVREGRINPRSPRVPGP